MPETSERTALLDLYTTQERDGLDPFLAELYPHYLPSPRYLGTAGSCPNGGPGILYGPWDWEADWCVTLVRVVEWGSPTIPAPTALYRLFDKTGSLLYVGISLSPAQRWVHHSEHKAWWPQVARIEFDWCASRDEALRIEAEAIRAERPRHNVQHNSAAA
ncbi:GIY-YIG nuclease family protein [Streptomyces sp. NPDC048256]|uniref:GIY-YIG nuclease family protein n=1 Tax=Streptomyces sp. NPDC048256 TaxID=3154613 RepID=UPI00340E10B7